ncbi:hypothetical protein FACS189438_0260 [Bacteroidia bacterium]|nr:hypothetical protein FACS189438_0260 [Bacteroidia bacterium]
MGYLVYYVRINMNKNNYYIMFLIFMALSYLIFHILPPMSEQIRGSFLDFSNQFIADCICGVMIAFVLSALPTQQEKEYGKASIV